MPTEDQSQEAPAITEAPPVCGIIMPISGMDDCSEGHWAEVKDIICRSIVKTGLTPKMVNESQEVAIIHGTIVKNIFNNPIVVCDISQRNANVMFELGMRLAFGKHVVIVKDDRTDAPFDTGVIEYIQYPRDLRYSRIEEFVENLYKKITATYESIKKEAPSPFLEHFKDVRPAQIERGVIPFNEYLERKFSSIDSELTRLNRNIQRQENKRKFNNLDLDRTRELTLKYQIFLKMYNEFCQTTNIDPSEESSMGKWLDLLSKHELTTVIKIINDYYKRDLS
jgi:hypothetical protein